ncbi:MAG: histidine kinase [Bacteroidota bacterium]
MFYRHLVRFFTVVCVFILMAQAAIAANPPVTADTARLISLAREARELLKTPGNKARADSILAVANTLASTDKPQIPLLLHWANAEARFQKQEFGKAYEMAVAAIKSPQSQIGLQAQGELLIFYAKTCQNTGQFSTSIEALERTIKFAKSNHLKNLLPRACQTLANLYGAFNQPEKVNESLEQMLEFSRLESDPASGQIALDRLGKLRLNYKRDFKTVDRYFRGSLEISMSLGDTAGIASTLSDIAWNLYVEQQLDSSLYYYNKAIEYGETGKRYYTLANAYGNIGTVYRDMKKYDKARIYWGKGIETAKIINDWYTPSWIYKDMSQMAADQGNYRDAYKFQLYYKEFSDSLASQKSTEGLNLARAKFEADTVKKEVELLSLRLKNQRLLIYGFAGFLLLTVIIGLLLFWQSRLNSKRRISEMDKKILEVTQANLRQQMNPHFIFNTLNSIQYYMYKHDKLATNNYLTKFSSLMRKILENSQHTSIPIRDELDALQLYLELESIRFRDKFDYEISVDDEIDPLMFKIPTMLIQPYVENAICHGLMYREEKGKVKVSLTYCKDYISCIIEDNGIGREASRELNRNLEKNHNSLGTQITESRLKLVSTLYGTSLKTIFTDLKDNEGNGEGTRVEIHIPILT